MSNKISVIIPAYNEQKTIGKVADDIKEILDKAKTDYELIVVNDGSRDRTRETAEKIRGIKLINNPYNLGYGASIKKGIKESSGSLILIIDADGTYPVEAIPKLLEYSESYDMVVGARTGEQVDIPFMRRPAKWVITAIANFLSGKKIPDLNSGLRVFKREVAEEFFHLFPSGFSFTTTITLACLTNDYTVKYIPINYYKRKGKSTIHPIKDFINFVTLILRLITYFNPLKMFFFISALLFLVAAAIFLYSSLMLERVMDITVIILLVASLQIFLFGLLAEITIKRAER